MHHEDAFAGGRADNAQLCLGDHGQGPLAADNDPAEVERSGPAGIAGAEGVAVAHEFVQVVAADAPQDLRKPGHDLVAVPRSDLGQLAVQGGHEIVPPAERFHIAVRDRLQPRFGAVGEHAAEFQHVIDRLAVQD